MATSEPTETGTEVPAATETPEDTATPTESATAVPIDTETPTASVTPEDTATATPTEPIPTAAATETATAGGTATALETAIPMDTPTPAQSVIQSDGTMVYFFVYCVVENCHLYPSFDCAGLRDRFEQLTGSRVLPCEAPPTPAP